MTRMNVLKHLVFTVIFSGLCITSIYAHEFQYDKSNTSPSICFPNNTTSFATYHSRYEQRARNSEIKLSGILAVVAFVVEIIKWFRQKQKDVILSPQPLPAPATRFDNEFDFPWVENCPSHVPIVHIPDLQKEHLNLQTQASPEVVYPAIKEKDTHAYFEDLKAVDVPILAYYRCERIIEDIAIYYQDALSSTKENKVEIYTLLTDIFKPNGVVDIAIETEKLL